MLDQDARGPRFLRCVPLKATGAPGWSPDTHAAALSALFLNINECERLAFKLCSLLNIPIKKDVQDSGIAPTKDLQS